MLNCFVFFCICCLQHINNISAVHESAFFPYSTSTLICFGYYKHNASLACTSTHKTVLERVRNTIPVKVLLHLISPGATNFHDLRNSSLRCRLPLGNTRTYSTLRTEGAQNESYTNYFHTYGILHSNQWGDTPLRSVFCAYSTTARPDKLGNVH